MPRNVYFKFTVENTGDIALINVRVNDLTIPGLDLSNCTTALDGGLPVADLAGSNVKTCVSGPVTVSSAGAYANTANATSDTVTSANSPVQYATAGLLLTKSVDRSSFTAEGNILTYTYAVYNNGSTGLTGTVTVADDKAMVNCPAVTTVGNLDNVLDPGEGVTCTATYTVQAADVNAGYVTNTATATVNSVNSNTVSKTVLRDGLPDLRVTKGDNVSGSVVLGNSFNWTLLVMNAGLADATFTSEQTILSDQLPAAATYGTLPLTLTPGNFTNVTNSVNITCSIASNVLTCIANGGSVTIGNTSGSFTVAFGVTPTETGSLENTVTVDPDINVAESIETNNTGSGTVIVSSPTAVNLASFTAIPAPDGVTLAWEHTSGQIGQAASSGWPVGLVGLLLLSAAAVRRQRKRRS